MPELKGLLESAKRKIGGLLGDFPQGFNAGAVAGVAGYPGDIAYMLDTAGRAVTGQETMPAAQDFFGTTDYLAAKAGYPIPQSFSGQLGAAVGGFLSPGPGDLARLAPVLSAIPFWHGSPHKFDAFDLSKMGSGEGAQAYGWGAYGAEAPDTALSYKNALSGDQGFYLDGNGPLTRQEVQNIVNGEERKYLDGVSRLSGVADIVMDEKAYGWVPKKAPKRYKDGSERLSAYEALKQRIDHPDNGHLYRGEYRWPDPAKEAATPLTGEDLLDWDRPLSEQNEAVKRFFEPYVAETRKALSTPGEAGWGELAAPINFDPTGNELLNILSRHVNPEHGKLTVNTVLAGGTGGSYTSEVLKNAGIPGTRYLDGVSRGAGEGTRNYVMFDDKGIKLLERNGEPIKAAEDFAARRAGKAKPYKEAMGIDTIPAMPKQEPPKTAPDYGMEHRPPMRDSGAPGYDLTGGGSVYPDDVYQQGARYYGTGDDAMDYESFRLAQYMKGRPEREITIYRAVPYEPTNSEKLASLEAQKAKYMARRIVPAEWGGGRNEIGDEQGFYDWVTKEIETLKNTPDTVAPKRKINSGDWVSINKQYAKQHGEREFGKNYKVITKKVKAKDIYTNGDSIHEWGYDPDGAQ